MDLDEEELKATRELNGSTKKIIKCNFNVNDIVIFNKKHKWSGCIGRITNIKYISSMCSNEVIPNIEVTVNIPDKDSKIIYTSMLDIELVNSLQYKSDKQKLIEILEKANELDKETVQYYEKTYRDTKDEFYKISYKRQIDMANARRITRKNILELLQTNDICKL